MDIEETKRAIMDSPEFFKDKLSKAKDIVRIKMGGEYLFIGNNKKTVWSSMGAAKNAFRCHCKEKITTMILQENGVEPDEKFSTWRPYWPPEQTEKAFNIFLKKAKAEGFLEFVKL